MVTGTFALICISILCPNCQTKLNRKREKFSVAADFCLFASKVFVSRTCRAEDSGGICIRVGKLSSSGGFCQLSDRYD